MFISNLFFYKLFNYLFIYVGSADKVCWHSSGNYYMLVVDKEVQVN
jgi:hypothetical protein